MDALKFNGVNQLVLENVPVPKVVNADDVLIKVSVAGVCGTDLHILSGDFDAKTGVILGHECVGVVEAIGKGVTHFKVGDRIVVDPHGNCNKCFYCLRSCPHFCIHKSDHPSVGMKRDGGFAKHVVVPEVHVHHLSPAVSAEQGILLEPFSCIMHAVNRAEPIEKDADVLVMGAGIIGLLATIYLSNRGVKSLTVVELIDHRRDTVNSLKLKGVRAIKPDELKAEKTANEKDTTWGFDRSFDFTGAPPAIQMGFDMLRKRGRLVLFGVMKKDAKVNFSPYDLLYKEVTVTGALINPGTMDQAVNAVDTLSKANLLSMDILDIKSFKLADYKSAFEALKSGSIAKAMLVP